MKITSYIKMAILFTAFMTVVGSCSKFSDDTPPIMEESEKPLDGTWRIVKVSRNGSEITTLMDFSKFRLTLNEDKTYTINEYLPFLVRDDGTWNVDDPQYPFRIIFKENGSSTDLISSLSFPVTSGVRQIKLTFSPGCYSNAYTYEFERVSN